MVRGRHGAVRPLGLASRLVASSGVRRWLFGVTKAVALLVAAAAAAGIIGGAMRSSLLVIVLSWSLLSVAVAALYAVSRIGIGNPTD